MIDQTNSGWYWPLEAGLRPIKGHVHFWQGKGLLPICGIPTDRGVIEGPRQQFRCPACRGRLRGTGGVREPRIPVPVMPGSGIER